MGTLLIRKGRVIDPSRNLDAVRDLWIKDGRIAPEGFTAERADEVIDAPEMLVMPGFVDVHVHLREPGNEQAETIESGCAAALAGGFTSIVCMPNTTPAIDNPEMVKRVLDKAASARGPRVYVMGAITLARQGKRLAPLDQMAKAGVVGFTDDGGGVQDETLTRMAIQRAAALGLRIAEHCEVARLSEGGVMRRGPASERACLPGLPPEAESEMVARDLRLARELKCSVHLQHLSAVQSVALIRAAKARGVPFTAEVTPHHLALTDEQAADGGPDFKMNPPLGFEGDRKNLCEALRDNVIEIIATDHAPHTAAAKARGFKDAPSGVIGMENAAAVVWTFVAQRGFLTPAQMAARMSTAPAAAFKIEGGTLKPGARADVVLFNPNVSWVVKPEEFRSRSRNCPFAGRTLHGRVACTIVGGEVKYRDALR
jgi:dihydroorotase